MLCFISLTEKVLAVEDMRHELDDEGRREFEEELGDGDGDIGSRGDDGRCATVDIVLLFTGCYCGFCGTAFAHTYVGPLKPTFRREKWVRSV